MGRHVYGQTRSLNQVPLPVHDRGGAQLKMLSQQRFMNHADSHGLTVNVSFVTAQGLQGVTNGMPIIQDAAQAGFLLIFGHDPRFNFATTLDHLDDVLILHVKKMAHSLL